MLPANEASYATCMSIHRLKVFPITVPPLRERLDDVPLLARFFIDLYSKQMGKPSGDITIRTLVVKDGETSVTAGAFIVK